MSKTKADKVRKMFDYLKAGAAGWTLGETATMVISTVGELERKNTALMLESSGLRAELNNAKIERSVHGVSAKITIAKLADEKDELYHALRRSRELADRLEAERDELAARLAQKPEPSPPTEGWVLHSPYDDGSWRGIEKCSHDPKGSLRVFSSEEEAMAHRNVMDMPEYVKAWKVGLVVPNLRDWTELVPSLVGAVNADSVTLVTGDATNLEM